MEYNRKLDIVIPLLTFAILAIVGIWMIAANGQWWKSAIPSDFMPNPVLYYIIWSVFLVIYPFLYIMSLATASNSKHRIVIHTLFLLLAVFLLLWVIYLYHVKDVRLALIFIGIAWLLMLILVIYLWMYQMWSRSAPTSGMALLFLIWLTLTWFLTSAARQEGLSSMFKIMRERFLENSEKESEIKL